MRVLNFKVILMPDETRGYVVTCRALPGLGTEGDTIGEAREMAADAIRGYLGILQKDDALMPADEVIIERITVKLPD